MDLRSLPDGLSPSERINLRRQRVEDHLGIDLKILTPQSKLIGDADQKNCEQMIGHVPIPIGIAGRLSITFSNQSKANIYLPLATTEGALVASVNRGCKAVSVDGVTIEKAIYHGMTRSLAFKLLTTHYSLPTKKIKSLVKQWKHIGEATSNHLKILRHAVDVSDDHLFLTIACDTDQAMGMNMVTIAAQAIGIWIEKNVEGLRFITVAGNVDSDKKPSKRTHDLGRGYEVIASAKISEATINDVLKSDAQSMLATAKAKLEVGSKLAGALGSNLHAANTIAALYLATGQDTAHVVEGSLTDTTVKKLRSGLEISVRCPAILVGVRGGGTSLPAQKQCLELLLKCHPEERRSSGFEMPSQKLGLLSLTPRHVLKGSLHPSQQLAESIAAAVLAGEISLLAAQASHMLAKAHKKLGR